MSRHFDRGTLLMQQGRTEEAIREFHAVLAAEPDHATTHAFLALLHAEREAWREADEHARRAVTLEPGDPFGHFTLAKVFFGRNRFDEATAAVGESIRLDPDQPHAHAMLGAIHLSTGKWKEALAAADAGLAIDPENDTCTSIRTQALLQLGDTDAAAAASGAALRRAPDRSSSQSDMGYTMLHRGEPTRAVEYFREALRLDPSSDAARLGLVEALKARNPVYRRLLGYVLWMNALQPRVRWGLVVGGYLAVRLLARVKPADAAQAWMIGIALTLYACFALLTWIGGSLFNLLLLADPVGRHALDDDQRRGAILFGTLAGVAILSAVAGFAMGSAEVLIVGLVWGLTTLVATTIHSCDTGWPRRTAAVAVGIVGILAATVTAAVAGAIVGGGPVKGLFDGGLPRVALGLFFPIWFVVMILAQFLARARVRH